MERAADRLMNAIVAAGLCDPGANGPRARLARLPVGVNGKHTPPFPCRMVEWSPELRYSVDELVDGLELEMAEAGRPKRQGTRRAQERPVDGDPVWIPRPDENAVLVALRQRGLYKAPLGDGKHDITCPWVKEHTDEVDGGTAYFEPDDNWPIGGFKCLHGHCAERHVRDLLRVHRHRGQRGAHEAHDPDRGGGNPSRRGCGRARAGALWSALPTGRTDRDRSHRSWHPRDPCAGDPSTGLGAGAGRRRHLGEVSTPAPRTGYAPIHRPAMRRCCSIRPAITTCRC